ncbi:FecR family protein [Thalassobellus suaedae]|uniref:FecR family protein n=1 Tax=Thalassobellus suaedae TaxID=3074124 RepID=A0ABY9XTV0_9FLAO|nr:FecR family protein [Flavobacteriaceae bacterium HL-DH14]
MVPKETENIIVKFLTHQCSSNELDYLEDWLQDSGNYELFLAYVKINYSVDYNLKSFEKTEVRDSLLSLIDDDKKLKESKVVKLKIINNLIKVSSAAIIIGVLATAYMFNEKLFNYEREEPVIVNSFIEPGTDKSTLTLEDGSEIELNKGEEFVLQNVNSNGEEIIYEDKGGKDLKYNILTVPRGGQFQITLSDGTKVWLNSESQLKYPVAFLKGNTRTVELVYGEAYFDVTSSERNGGDDFKVYQNDQEVHVLGTEFNIKAYKEEANIYTTLVEGEIELSVDDKIQHVAPNQQVKLNVLNRDVKLAEVDVASLISWKEGVFSFEDMSLQEIMVVLSRWYDMDVVFENEAIKSEEFMGVLFKDRDIKEILKSIKNSGVINDYKFNEKKLILN